MNQLSRFANRSGLRTILPPLVGLAAGLALNVILAGANWSAGEAPAAAPAPWAWTALVICPWCH